MLIYCNSELGSRKSLLLHKLGRKHKKTVYKYQFELKHVSRTLFEVYGECFFASITEKRHLPYLKSFNALMYIWIYNSTIWLNNLSTIITWPNLLKLCINVSSKDLYAEPWLPWQLKD